MTKVNGELRQWEGTIMIRLGCVILSIASGLAAKAVAADFDPAKLEQIVSSSAEKYVEAFQERDSKKLAALFTEAAVYIDGDGAVFHGREAIQAEYEAYFESASKGELKLELTVIRPIADNVIIEEGVSEFLPEDDGPVSLTRYAATHVQQKDGEWLIAGVRELAPAEMTNHERLKALQWLIGSWNEEVPGRVITTEWTWSADGSYLIARFSMMTEDGTGRAGTHRVGWDAQRKQFRSWVFDAEGSFAEGTWADRDGGWEITLAATLASGESATGVLRYERDGEDAMIVSQLRRVAGGESVPDTETRVV
ncbi:MAG: hypothetical protein B7Z55_18210, partial [Planctomycetales bacterium 12-60-4]